MELLTQLVFDLDSEDFEGIEGIEQNFPLNSEMAMRT